MFSPEMILFQEVRRGKAAVMLFYREKLWDCNDHEQEKTYTVLEETLVFII